MESKNIRPEGECTKKHIKGVSCDVHNCIYHDCGCYCTADHIAVGPSNARSSADTICATFKEKKM